jgi:fatty acid desaturase
MIDELAVLPEETPKESLPSDRAVKKTALFANTKLDAILVGFSFFGIALYVVTGFYFKMIPWYWLLAIGTLASFLICFNSECITHSHNHTPFFRSKFLNKAFSVINTLALGEVVTINNVFHFNHHRYVNDMIDPETGKTGDWTSSYRLGKNGEQQPFIPYVLGMVLRYRFYRKDMKDVHHEFEAEVKRRKLKRQIQIESAAQKLFLVFLLWLNWKFFLFYYWPVWFVGSVAAWGFGYGEHYGTKPGNRKTDSVSSYNPIYNFFMFNNGYHQEHHYRPDVHWSKIQRLHNDMLPEDQRMVIRSWHLSNLGLLSKPAGI